MDEFSTKPTYFPRVSAGYLVENSMGRVDDSSLFTIGKRTLDRIHLTKDANASGPLPDHILKACKSGERLDTIFKISTIPVATRIENP